MIAEFKNEYRWLSNFALVKITLDDIVYPSVEHAYQSAKSDLVEWKEFCSDVNNLAGKVKRQSRNITLKDNWHHMKIDVMRFCLKQKFNTEPYRTNLIQTGDMFIQEGNYRGDKFYGVCLQSNMGLNNLGILIMEIRKDLLKNWQQFNIL